MDIARDSNNPDTRISRLDFAEEKLRELFDLSIQHPRINAHHVSGVRAEIARLRLRFTTTVSFSSEELLSSQGVLAEVDGRPTHQLAEHKDDLSIMQACVRAETENYWMQSEGHRIMAAPFFFERAAILQRKAKNYEAEVAVCEAWAKIVEDYKEQDSVKNGIGAKVWLGPTSRKIMERLPRARELFEGRRERG